MSEKPFAPTEHRLRRASEEGNAPKAQELATLFSFSAVLFVLLHAVPQLSNAAAGWYIEAVARSVRAPLWTDGSLHWMLGYASIFAYAIAMLCVSGCVAGCIVALTATRARMHALSFKFERISPAEQWKQLFSFATVTALLRASLSAAVAAAALIPSCLSMIADSVGVRTPREMAAQAWQHVIHALTVLAAIGVATAAVEVSASLRKRRKSLRMTHDEVRREAKEQQGDPHLRSVRKRRHKAYARGGAAAARKATVLITNPTHLAVALLYAPPEIGVPIVVARAADAAAHEVRRAAREAQVPCVEHVALARALWAQCEEGQAVPSETYALVAPIIAAVMRESRT
jgi:flagellar biosynthesis protein FlhB